MPGTVASVDHPGRRLASGGKHGLTIDSLLGAEIDSRRAFERCRAPSRLALGPSAAGVGTWPTRFHYKLHELKSIVGGMLVLPATPETVASFIALAEAAPEELSTIANVMSAPPMPFLPPEVHGKLILFCFLVYAGDTDAGERAILPFRKIATPFADMVRPIRYPDMFPPEQEGYHPTAVGRNMFLNQVDRTVAQTIIEHLEASDASMRVVQLRVLGGAMARVPVDATAYAHRQAPIMANLAAFYDGAEDKIRREIWIDDFAAAMQQGYSGVYVNFLAGESPSRVRDAYPGKTWERLASIKARYDPDNLFRLNHNITPAR
jgi:hypothetical protein